MLFVTKKDSQPPQSNLLTIRARKHLEISNPKVMKPASLFIFLVTFVEPLLRLPTLVILVLP